MIYIIFIILVFIYELQDFPEPGELDLLKGFSRINNNDYISALNHFEKSATYDNEKSLVLTASFYYYGFINQKRQLEKAFQYYTRAITVWENPIALFMIGIMYYHGEFISKNQKTAIKWITSSAKKGNSDAQAWLGYMYHAQFDYTQAELWYKLAYESKIQHNNNHSYVILSCKEFQLHLNKNQVSYLSNHQSVLEMGCFSSTNRLANHYIHETDKKEDIHKLFWYSITESGNFYHHFLVYLGTVYSIGLKGFKEHNNIAFRCFQHAALSGDAKAQYCLGSYFDEKKKNKNESFPWYMMAKNNNVDALFKVAEAYCYGYGVSINYKKSIDYFEDYLKCRGIFNNGYIHNLMGQMYANGGYGIERNYSKALRLFTISVDEFSYKKGFTNLGLMHAKGYGVKKDLKKACLYYRKGAERKCKISLALLEKMESVYK